MKKVVQKKAFSLVEMLMALLVASLLMVALAPVMTKKFNETISIGGGNQFVHEVAYNSPYCPVGAEPKKYDDGTEYCEGEFTVPMGVNKIEVTLVGGGGGGAAAATAGLWEKKEAGTEDFKVPQLANQLEVTLVGGGSGGGAGGQRLKNVTFVADGKENFTQDATNIVEEVPAGEKNWTIPEALKGKYAKVTGCGGGGGAGGTYHGDGQDDASIRMAGGGGSGAYIKDKVVTFPDQESIAVTIGGGGGHGGGRAGVPQNGKFYGGGGGSFGNSLIGTSPLQDLTFGNGGIIFGVAGDSMPFTMGGYGGMGGGEDGENGFYEEDGVKIHKLAANGYNRRMAGGTGNGGGNGGGGMPPSNNDTATACGGGGGGGLIGAGGGGGCTNGGGGGGGGRTALGSLFVAPGGGGGGGTYHSGGGGGGAGQTVDNDPAGKGGAGGNASASWFWASGVNQFIGGGGGSGGTPNGGNAYWYEGGIAGIVNGDEKELTIFGSNYCNGGDGGGKKRGVENYFTPTNGKDGALRVTYVDYGPGGSGGGNGHIAPVRPITVTPNETLSVIVPNGAVGGSAGEMASSGDEKKAGQGGAGCSYIAHLKRSGNSILSSISYDGYASYGGYGGCPTGIIDGRVSPWCSVSGIVTNGSPKVSNLSGISMGGFSSANARSAGDGSQYGQYNFAAKTSGGRGSSVMLFGKYFCEPGYGGNATYTESGEAKNRPLEGGDATGYGGCGGGGGYTFHDGGKGAPGYVRISWNKSYKRGSEDKYEYINGGSGGGGSAGNVFRYSIKVQAGDVLKYKVGKGGTGGGWTLVEKTVDGVTQQVLEQVQPTNGGMTELTTANNEILRAGGGLAGAFPLLNAITVDTFAAAATYDKDNLTAGLGGAAPNLCEFVNSSGETESFIDKEKLCTNKAGADGDETGGGKGSDAGFGAGTGGAAGITGGKLTASGSAAVGFGAGGGGAGLADLGIVNTTDAVTNPTVGGNGGDGKIIFRWK